MRKRVIHKATKFKKNAITGWMSFDKIVCGIKYAHNWNIYWSLVTCERCLRKKRKEDAMSQQTYSDGTQVDQGFKLEKSPWPSGGYYYLNKEDSNLYDELKDSADEKDQHIIRLILDKAEKCSGRHQASRY